MSEQRSAVVTGANSGFGRRTAELLADQGWRVHATLRDIEGRNRPAAEELRGRGVEVTELDVTSDASVDAAARTILAASGAPDLLVNNAGAGYFGLVEGFTPTLAEQQFAVNVIGPLCVNRAFLPAMRERRQGLVVYVSSIVGRFALPFAGVYSASKWALEALAETASYELSPFHVDVAIVQPGAYPTELGAKSATADDQDRVASYGDVVQLADNVFGALTAAAQGRDPGDVAQAILRLANMPAGSRPLRTTVPTDERTDAINAAVAPMQSDALKAFGLEALLPKAIAG